MLIQNHDRDINSETNRKDCAKDSIRDSVLLSRRLTELIYRSDSFVRHENKPAAGRENRPAGICDSAFTFPVLCDASLKEKELRIIDRPDRFYRLADFARAHYDELFPPFGLRSLQSDEYPRRSMATRGFRLHDPYLPHHLLRFSGDKQSDGFPSEVRHYRA